MLNAGSMVSLDEEIAIQNKIMAGMSWQEQMMKMKCFRARAQSRVAKGTGPRASSSPRCGA